MKNIIILCLIAILSTYSCVCMHNYTDFSSFSSVDTSENTWRRLKNSAILLNPEWVKITRILPNKKLYIMTWMPIRTTKSVGDITQLQSIAASFGEDTLALKKINVRGEEFNTLLNFHPSSEINLDTMMQLSFYTSKDYLTFKSFKEAYLRDTLTISFCCDSLNNKVTYKMVGRDFRYRKVLLER